MSLVSFLTHGVDLLKHALNDCISRASAQPAFPCGRNQQVCVVQKDGKHPDGCTLIPWRGGRALAWGVTVCAPQWLLRT